MLEVFISKSILYVYQNVKWNQIKIGPKIYPQKNTFSCLKWPSYNVFSPEDHNLWRIEHPPYLMRNNGKKAWFGLISNLSHNFNKCEICIRLLRGSHIFLNKIHFLEH